MKKKLTFLVADYTPVIRNGIKDMLADILSDIDVDFFEAENANEVFDDLQAYGSDIDAIFLAWNMPDMSGDKILSLIREKDEYNNIKVIATASEKAHEELKDFKKLGLYAYLIKPFTQSDIEKAIKPLIER
jgi:DNA-binding LytR/AlgR family response regulator